MKKIIGVKFKREGKIYDFEAEGYEIAQDDYVIVKTEHGLAMGLVASPPRDVEDADAPEGLKGIVRPASDEDLMTQEENKHLEQEAKRFCVAKVKERNLPMKVVDVEYLFDRSKAVFSFTAENRVDFRELVRDLVQRFRMRIELKQIGDRQEARLVKGIGICGRDLCCTAMLGNLDRVSVKMAKEQGLSLNPEKISGICGRLMCCLAYEYEAYADVRKHMPKCGKFVQIGDVSGKVVRQDILREQIIVLKEDGKEASIPVSVLRENAKKTP